ncbi:MOSC domain-containing protein [Streptomyces sp. A7024]|uniref:MOSC domain-containing protein n=1 Tax=Streptomyces coryli TaxID=1128680 RepID=A0A6G4U9W3_9ACTN|nr:MOSC domain-containing protein [Streptomyces coryli]NGN68792.1 MOSC domain-containing protein [Streptomyces coryli]
MQIAELNRYPVKSMLGESLRELSFDARGAEADRLWAVTYDDGKLGSGKNSRRFRRTEGLLHYRASYASGVGARPRVTLPDGGELRDDAHLASLLGAEVRLARETSVGHFDDGPVSLATTASLRAFGDLLDQGAADMRRFRKNIVLDTDEPWTEEAWPGRELALGNELVLRVQARLPRCVMTTMSQANGVPEDRRVLKTLTEEREMCFGVVADVLTPGTLRVGDSARLL